MSARIIATAILAVCQVAVAQDPDATTPRYATILANDTQVRCFAGPKSPFFEDRLNEGQVVQVGDAQGDYRSVLLPGGPTGWVHKKFTSEPEDGVIVTTGERVSFRYRPKASEVPAAMLPKGSELVYLGEKGDWWKVRSKGVSAYLASSEIKVWEQPTDTVLAAWAELGKVRQRATDEARTARAAAKAAAKAAQERQERLAALVAEYSEIAEKPLAEQSYDALEAKLKPLLAELPADSPEHGRAVALGDQIDSQQLLVRARQVVSEKVPVRNAAAEILRPTVVDPMSRFDAVGWLRVSRPPQGLPVVTLEKGGQLLYEVVCTSGRYDLPLFEGAEVGIRGGKTRPSPDRVRQLDALKIEILRLSH